MPHSVSSEASSKDTLAAISEGEQQAATSAAAEQVIGEEDVEMTDGEESEAAPQVGAASGQDAAPVPPIKKEPTEVELNDLFADDDDDEDDGDEEFPSSLPEKIGADAATLKASDPEVMRSFYQRLFPWRYLFQWLNHSPTPTNDFGHREFAFTLQNDAYLRYQSFPTADLLRKDVLRLMPSRFEIGPVYTTNPRDRKSLSNTSAFRPLAKELCFDIDLTDYDDVRTCCDKANICLRCWQFISMAIEVVDTALRDDFGFRHIMWVYSGRRGAHAWVCDRRARTLDDQRRRAIAGYLEVVRGGAQGGKKVHVRRPLHPHLARSLQTLRPYFDDAVLREQDPWGTPERAEKLLQLLPDRTLNEALRRKWDATGGGHRSSEARWADIDSVAKTAASKAMDARALLEAKQDIMLEYTYPRLDIEVSKKLNHLLKSPFVVHPGTGRVCVPIDPRRLEDFDPLSVPTVQSLLQEIDAWSGQGGEGGEGNGEGNEKSDDNGAAADKKPLQDWEKTSLRPYIEQFRSFVLALMRDESDVKVKREREEGVEF